MVQPTSAIATPSRGNKSPHIIYFMSSKKILSRYVSCARCIAREVGLICMILAANRSMLSQKGRSLL
jgi:hypothetical protein